MSLNQIQSQIQSRIQKLRSRIGVGSLGLGSIIGSYPKPKILNCPVKGPLGYWNFPILNAIICKSRLLGKGAICTSVNATGVDLLSNAGFESGALSPWKTRVDGPGKKTGSFGTEMTRVHSGKYAGYIYDTGQTDFDQLFQEFQCCEGERYELTGYGWADGLLGAKSSDGANLYLDNLDSSGVSVVHSYSKTLNGQSSSWTLLKAWMTCAVNGTIKAVCITSKASGYAYFDDLSLTRRS